MSLSVYLDGRPLDIEKMSEISLPIDFSMRTERAWYIGPPVREPVRLPNWTGSTELGGSVNFYNLRINPHAHGTHIETSWHIDHTRAAQPVVHQLFYKSYLYTCSPLPDRALDLSALWQNLPDGISSVVLRTMPNDDAKYTFNYSDTHPPYLKPSDAAHLAQSGISILLIDLPSVDPERDDGALAAHRQFWDNQKSDNANAALIGEFLYIPNIITDGEYALHIQHPSMNTDAVPARIFLIPYVSL
ncbi:MAG: cyclase family protein [Thermaurantimonas sp.]